MELRASWVMKQTENILPYTVKKGQCGSAHPSAKPDHAKRSKVIAVRVTADELAAITAAAKSTGLSISKFVRQKINLPT